MSTATGTALITGSAQGLGRAIAVRLARDGFDIALNDVSEPSKREQLHAVADEIEKIGRRTLVILADVSVDGEVEGMVEFVVKIFGGLDVMVANAGIGRLSPVVSADVEEWERVMAVNARGPFLCYKYAAQQMIQQGRGGRIIGASSISGKVGAPLTAAYCASKFAVRGLTQTAALELGQHNITVNCYAPGIIRTAMFQGAVESVTERDLDMLNSSMTRLGTGSLGYEGQPEDIASIVSYLASKEAHFITGQCISVDGGVTFS